jgi:hypothetical protein
MIHTSLATTRLFSHKVSVIFEKLLPVLSNTTCTSDVKIPCLEFGAHNENSVSVPCHLQDGVYVVHPLQGQRGVSRRAKVGVRPVIVVKEKDVFHVSVRMNCADAL